MKLPFRSLRFRLVALPMASLIFWLAMTLTGAIYDARLRIAAEVKASSALAHALAEAALAKVDTSRDPASALLEAQRHLPHTRHVRMGVIGPTDDTAKIDEAVRAARAESPVPAWFIDLISAHPPIETVEVKSSEGRAGAIYILPDPADEIEEVWEDFQFVSLVAAALIAAIIGSILWIANGALRPLDVLGSGLERLERGDFSVNLKPMEFVELERIGDQFNRLARSLAAAMAENRLLCQRLLTLQENERNHIARELHDELGPCLFGIRAEAAFLLDGARKKKIEPRDVAARAKSIDALVEGVQQINRRLLFSLQPIALAERGLGSALRDLVEGWRTSYPDIHWSLELSDEALRGLSQEVSLAIYRMAQEGLTNIARHSCCTRAQLSIRREDGGAPLPGLRLLIADNGKGFSDAGNGTGLLGMRERIRNLGGELIVIPGLGSGTRLEAFIPLS